MSQWDIVLVVDAPHRGHEPAVSQRRYVAFIRNIMIGRNGLTADLLKDSVLEAGGQQPRSHLATGNIVFTSTADSVMDVGRKIESAVETILGRREEVFIRAVDDLVAAVGTDPYATMMSEDVHERCVSFLPSGCVVDLSLPDSTPRGDLVLFAVRDEAVFSITRLVSGRPGQPGKYLEIALDVRVTTRNWNTIERIAKIEG